LTLLAGGIAQWLAFLPRMCEALGSTPALPKKQKQNQKNLKTKKANIRRLPILYCSQMQKKQKGKSKY
jgi:uncharacterized protein YqcC (DUF446 family)